MGNDVNCFSTRPLGEKVIVEEGWQKLLQDYAERENKSQHEALEKKRKTLSAMWVNNSKLTTKHIFDEATEMLMMELFRATIQENRKKLADVEYMRNVMVQTKSFQDPGAERILHQQEISSTGNPVYYEILGKIWDKFAINGKLQRYEVHRVMRSYFSAFRRFGRRILVEGMSIGAEFAARQVGGGKDKAMNYQSSLRRRYAKYILDKAYNSVLAFAKKEIYDSVYWRLVASTPAPQPPLPVGHLSKESFQKGFLAALATIMDVRRIEKELDLPDPIQMCRAEEKRQIAIDRAWEKKFVHVVDSEESKLT